MVQLNGRPALVPVVVTGTTGRKLAVLLASPLAGDNPSDPELAESIIDAQEMDCIVVNELLIRGTLPADTKAVQDRLRG